MTPGSHINITSILSIYLSPADSIFSPNANDLWNEVCIELDLLSEIFESGV